MITNWGEKVARRLAASGTISSEDIDLYGYGFFLLLSSTLYLVVVAVFGSVFGVLWESSVFYLLFSILRGYAGGIHAKTEYGCMLSTILALLLSTMGIRGMLQAERLTMAMMLLIVGCAVVFLFSPLDVPEKPLSTDDWRYYRRISRNLAVAYVLFGVWARVAGWRILYPLAASTTLEGILLLSGTANLKKRTLRKEDEF
mgnify:CR=1 FL=1